MHLQIKATKQSKSFYVNHNHHKDGDSGFDLFTPREYIIPSKSFGFMIDFEIKCKGIREDGKGCSFWLIPRSSMGSKTPLRLSNSLGLIDKGYRGSIKGCFDNLSDNDYILEKGTRILQITSPNLDEISYELVDDLDETERGEGGFGSTGN